MKDNKIYYSEIFGNTIQGEGLYTGVPTVWIRFFLCNLTCGGFGQEEPTKPETWKLDSNLIDLVDITDITELPVFERGCDSAYSVAKRYKHLQKHETVEEIVDRIQALLPNGKFKHPVTKQPIHFAFTGGEPLLNQKAIIDILNEMAHRNMELQYVTFETNGTRELSNELIECFVNHYKKRTLKEILWSVSPKLLNTSGEQRKKAFKPEIFELYMSDIKEALCKSNFHYKKLSDVLKMQIKFVANGSTDTWNEIDEIMSILQNDHFIDFYYDGPYSFWIMPVGGTLEGQEGKVSGHIGAGKIAEQAIERGFNVSARVHNYLWSNVVGK